MKRPWLRTKKKRVRRQLPTLFRFVSVTAEGNDAPLPALWSYGLVTCKLSLPVAGAIGLIVIV